MSAPEPSPGPGATPERHPVSWFFWPGLEAAQARRHAKACRVALPYLYEDVDDGPLAKVEALCGDLTCPACNGRRVKIQPPATGTLRLFVCDECGHVQVVDFHPDAVQLRMRDPKKLFPLQPLTEQAAAWLTRRVCRPRREFGDRVAQLEAAAFMRGWSTRQGGAA